VSPNVAASVRARLLSQARAKGEEFERVLVRFACERFLYRLGESTHAGRCTLKGAGLLVLWLVDPYRPTRDLDFLAQGDNDAAAIRALMHEVCSVPCEQDGLRFDLDSLAIESIRADAEYPGQRARLLAYLGTARIRLQVDFGFGDVVTPPPEEREFPTLLSTLPTPRIRAYRREVSLAEKFQAMVQLGRRTSRMKDFHDVWALSEAFDFDGTVLQEAVSACFECRDTPWMAEPPEVLGETFYANAELGERWASYARAGAFLAAPPAEFAEIGERVRVFLGPVRDAIFDTALLALRWRAGGEWS
jgi:hypothetical protein